MEERMNTICDSMGDASEDELNQMMEELGVIQEMMDATISTFWIRESKRSAVHSASRRSVSKRDVTELSGGQNKGCIGRTAS